MKYMKRYSGEDYSFIINRAKLDDRGEYIIRAENHYGAREEPVFLNVQREYPFFVPCLCLSTSLVCIISFPSHTMKHNLVHSSYYYPADLTSLSTALPPEIPQYRPQEQIVRRRQPLAYKMWQEESESAPSFTFLLRPRVIQCHQTCKLLCCLSGKPVPTVKWFKGNQELSKFDYSMSHSDGVVAMEIVNCRPEDSGKYKCVATNHHGTDETACVVIVEGKCGLKTTTAIS